MSLPSLSGISLSFSFLLPLAAAAQSTPSPEVVRSDEYFAKGVALHQGGDILGAIDAYEAALRATPWRLEARSNLGAALVRLGRYPEAVEQYTRALETDPGQVAVRFNLGLALYKSARIDEAAAEFQRVVERDASQQPALLLLADCELQMGNDARVIELLTPHEAAFGEDHLFAYLLGTALIRSNEAHRGQQLVDRLFRDGESAEGQLLLGAQHLRRGDHRGAIPGLRRAAELNPDLPTVHSLLGLALMNSGERAAAVPEFRRELEKNPNDFQANLRLGLLLRDENLVDEASDYVQRAARLRPKDPDVLYGLGRIYLAQEKPGAAQGALEELTRLMPEFEGAHVLLATLYYRQQKKDLGDRERSIVDKLRAERKAREAPSPDATREPPGEPQS